MTTEFKDQYKKKYRSLDEIIDKILDSQNMAAAAYYMGWTIKILAEHMDEEDLNDLATKIKNRL